MGTYTVYEVEVIYKDKRIERLLKTDYATKDEANKVVAQQNGKPEVFMARLVAVNLPC